MAKRKVLFKWFTIADYQEEEKWLSKQQQAGWKLVKVHPLGFYTFEETSHTQGVYKLDFKNQNPAEDYIQMYRDYGWEYVTKCNGWNYFRSIEGAQVGAEELDIFSDDASKLEMIQELLKKRVVPGLFVLVVSSLLFPYSRMSSPSISINILLAFYACLLLANLLLVMTTGSKLLKVKKLLKNSIRN